MAKHNVVQLYGLVLGMPQIQKNEATGTYERGTCKIAISNGTRDIGDKIDHVRFNKPMIMSGDPEQIAIMSTWKTNDMVQVKGAFTTMNISKRIRCPHCEEIAKVPGTLAFISPIHSKIIERNLSEEKGTELLKKDCEISNQVLLVGNLCKDVDFYRNDTMKMSTYQLAVNRKYFIKGDVAESRTDYPYVHSFGDQAFSDQIALREGSQVLIDGMIQSKEFKRVSKCENPECEHFGDEFEWGDYTLEVVPYSVEYLKDYTTREEYELLQSEKTEELKQKLFGKE